MTYFDEDFYTDDFDQEMLEWIESARSLPDVLGNTPEEKAMTSDEFLIYGTGVNCFWTQNTTPISINNHLTKQQFKEKIGMTSTVDTQIEKLQKELDELKAQREAEKKPKPVYIGELLKGW